MCLLNGLVRAWFAKARGSPTMPVLLCSEWGKCALASQMPDLVSLQNLPAILSSWKHFQVYWKALTLSNSSWFFDKVQGSYQPTEAGTALYLQGFPLAAWLWVLRNKARTMQWRKEQWFKTLQLEQVFITVVFKTPAKRRSKPHQQVFLGDPVCYHVSPPRHWVPACDVILNSPLRSLWSQEAEGLVLTGEFWFSQYVYWKQLSLCKHTSYPITAASQQKCWALFLLPHWKYPPDFKLQETKAKSLWPRQDFFFLVF